MWAMGPCTHFSAPDRRLKRRDYSVGYRIVDEELEDGLKPLRQPTAVALVAKDAVRVQHDSAYHQPQTQISSPGGARPVGCFDMYIGDRLDSLYQWTDHSAQVTGLDRAKHYLLTDDARGRLQKEAFGGCLTLSSH